MKHLVEVWSLIGWGGGGGEGGGGGYREWRRERERAQVGKGEECQTKVNKAWQMTLFLSRFANKLKELYSCPALLFITNKLRICLGLR